MSEYLDASALLFLRGGSGVVAFTSLSIIWCSYAHFANADISVVEIKGMHEVCRCYNSIYTQDTEEE